MALEHTIYVQMPAEMEVVLRELRKNCLKALEREKKLALGDRTEALRFEAIHAAIDQLAVAAIAGGDPCLETDLALQEEGPTVWLKDSELPPLIPEAAAAWIASGNPVIALRLPHTAGETSIPGAPGSGPPAVARRWRSLETYGQAAVRERFRSLILEALSGASGSETAIRPSGITNSILTETLREFATSMEGRQRTDLPVRYIDGSLGPAFPLAAVDLCAEIPREAKEFRFTLLSIRHVEMDAIVDGAWLRNSRVSNRRPQGMTDQICSETSLRQLRMLDTDRPTIIHMYQTGFEPAVVGFYRAVIHRLVEAPGSICVVPHFFAGKGQFREGKPWSTT